MLVGAVILAAGEAARMGRLKQLLPYRGRTLMEHAIAEAQAAGLAPIVVVVGAQAEAVAEVVMLASAAYVVNENWRTGMGSSLTAGVGKILELAPTLDAIAILLADQPHVTSASLSEMSAVLEWCALPIVTASYSGTVGVPAIFRRALFQRLQQLAPDAGARHLLRGEEMAVHICELPDAAIDIDTPEDYANLR